MIKKITLIISAFLLTMGIAQAQDVYFTGNDNGIGKIWKNNTLLYSISDTTSVRIDAMQIADNGMIYTAGCVYDTIQTQGHIWINGNTLFSADTNTRIYGLSVNDNEWTAGGTGKNEWGNSTGLVWQNGEVLYAYSDSISPNEVYALCIDPNTGDVYAGGINDSIELATVWKNDTILWQAESTSSICDLLHDGTDLYTCGYYYLEGLLFATAWQNDSIIYYINDLTLNSQFQAIAMYEGDLYLAGYVEDSVIVWKNGEVLFYHLFDEYACIYDLCVNEYGVYYAGQIDDVGTIWKDGEILYQPEDCQNIVAIAVMPSNDITPYPLPWHDGFETDSTYWEDWTILDFDSNHDIGWQRNDEYSATGSFSARHQASENIQEGWLITPPLYLSPYCDSTWVSFKTLEINPDSYTNSSLLISTTGTQLSDFTEIWTQDNPSDAWDSIHLDLSEYQGDTIYLAFKYNGHHGHDWYIDDVNVEEALTMYDITVEADSTGWGTVSGSGSYPYGETVTIEAYPETGREFICWNDSVVTNPRDIIVTQDSTFIAYFGTLQYTINVESNHPEWGSVSGSGTYFYGDTIEIAATPNMGYLFHGWEDGVVDNPRMIVVTGDATYIAHFVMQEYIITTEVTPIGAGTVSGGGTYYYHDTVQLQASANLGFEFIGWDDGSTENPRTIIVTESQTFIAHFKAQQYLITTEVTPEGAGTIDGGGIYDYGTVVQLIAHNNPGYVFSQWSDGAIVNPRTIFVVDDATYTAEFEFRQYEITTIATPEEGGIITGGGIYHYGDTATLTAIPNPNFLFLCWSDGVATNPRLVPVTHNATFNAIFHTSGTPEYTITVIANDPSLGIVTGSGTYPEGATIEISALPFDNAIFKKWADGNTDNPRSVTVIEDITYTAIFEIKDIPTYLISVETDNPLMGSVYGGGTFPANTTISFGAIPNNNFYFTSWQDGDTTNPRTITVTEDAVFIASFAKLPVQYYTITVHYDEDHGFVIGDGEYVAGSTATLAAIPADNYVFRKWSDESTDNPRQIIVDHDIVLTAIFEYTSVNENNATLVKLYPNPANDKIKIEGLDGSHEISIFNMFGVQIMTVEMDGDEEIDVSQLTPGVYFILINNKCPMRFIKN